MRASFKTGFSFGLTSGIITTLGLLVGLHAGTHSTVAVIGGILTIAIADAFSDALGMHIAQESQSQHTVRGIWETTASTFVSKFVVASTFLVPVLMLSLSQAVLVSVAWGMVLLTAISLHLARQEHSAAWKVVGEHVFIAGIVITLTHYAGRWLAVTFVSD